MERREHEDLVLGGSPRASIALYREGRKPWLPFKAATMSFPTTSSKSPSRFCRTASSSAPNAGLRKVTAEGVVQEILETTPVPTHREAAGST